MQYLLHLKQRNTCKPPLTNLATLLFKVLRLSQTSFELSSSKGYVWQPRNERKKREKRENWDQKEKLRKMKVSQKLGLQFVHKVAYIAIQEM